MATTELFRADPYRRTCAGRIAAVGPAGVVLDQTCFAPAGVSGEGGDHGWIGDHRIVAVAAKGDKRLVHRIASERSSGPDEVPLSVGDEVRCELDWPRRYRSMRLHTAQHLVEMALRWTHDLSAVSSKVVDDDILLRPVLGSGRLDLGAVSAWVETVVRDDLPMSAAVEPAPPHRWLWHLDGYGHRYCDRLHVRSTGEVGPTELARDADSCEEVRVSLPSM